MNYKIDSLNKAHTQTFFCTWDLLSKLVKTNLASTDKPQSG